MRFIVRNNEMDGESRKSGFEEQFHVRIHTWKSVLVSVLLGDH